MLDFEAMPWLRRLVAGLSPQRLDLDPKSFHARSVMDRVPLLFSLSVSFHQRSTLIFIYMLFLPEGQTGETWEPSKRTALTEIAERWVEKYCHLVFSERLDTKTDGLTDQPLVVTRL